MARLQPFRAWRPRPEYAAQVASPPYDVLSSDEARRMAAGNPLSFLHVGKPEIDLPQGTDVYSAAVYAKGGENLRRLIADGVLVREAAPSLYLYRQRMGSHVQTGVVAGASVDEYEADLIKKHEHTRLVKEDDRTRHIDALDAQSGPVFLTYKRGWRSMRSSSPHSRAQAYDFLPRTASSTWCGCRGPASAIGWSQPSRGSRSSTSRTAPTARQLRPGSARCVARPTPATPATRPTTSSWP
jgi:uncharacterized protein (DUF1015 family)